MNGKIKKALLVALSGLMVLNTPLSVLAESSPTDGQSKSVATVSDDNTKQAEAAKDTTDVKYEIVSVKDYDGTGYYQEIQVGTSETDKITENLPETLKANVKPVGDADAKEEEKEVPVTWTCPDEIVAGSEGTYVYTAETDPAYTWSEDLQKQIKEETYQVPSCSVSVVNEKSSEKQNDTATYAGETDNPVATQAGGTVVTDLDTSAIYSIYAYDWWDYVLDTIDHSFWSGDPLEVNNRTLASEEKMEKQVFDFYKYENGDYYYIRKYKKDRWFYITAPSSGNAFIDAWYGDGKDDSQLWRIEKNSDGSYSMYNKATGKALTYGNVPSSVGTQYSNAKWGFTRNQFLRTDPKVTKVTPGTQMDGTYSFVPRINKNTQVSVWGYSGKVYQKYEYNSENGRYYNSWNLAPTDADNGKIGFWLKDVGKYNGQTVDLKATLSWATNFTTSDGSKRITPYIGLFTSLGGDFAFGFFDASYEVKYEVYINGKLTPINSRITMTDIDVLQYTRLTTQTGSINNIFALDNYRLYREGNASDTSTGIIYAGNDGTTDTDMNGWVSCELKDCSTYTILYGSPRDTVSYSYYRNRVGYSYYYINNYGQDYLEKERVGKLDSIMAASDFSAISFCYWMGYDSSAFGPMTLPAPTETVSTDVTYPGQYYYYDVYQLLPMEGDSYKYKALTEYINIDSSTIDPTAMKETLNSAVVTDDSGNDITSLFNVACLDGQIIFTCTDTTVAKFDELYGTTLHFRIKVTNVTAQNALSMTLPKDIKSHATTQVIRNSSTTSGTTASESKDSNETTTQLRAKFYKKTLNYLLYGFTNGEGNVGNKTGYQMKSDTSEDQEASKVTLTEDQTMEAPNGFYFKNVTNSSGTALNLPYTFTVKGATLFTYYYYPYEYQISYDLDGGTNNSQNPSTYNVLYGKTLYSPEKDGYVFAGWTNESNLLLQNNGSSSFKATISNNFTGGNVRIYDNAGTMQVANVGTTTKVGAGTFKYTHNAESGYYRVQFNGVGNTIVRAGFYENVYLEKGKEYEISYNLKTLTSTQVEFDSLSMKETSYITGINEGKDGTSVATTNYASELASRRTGDLKLKAHWTRKNYYVKYDGNGATSGKMDDSEFVYDQDETLPAQKFAKTGYTFDVWKDDNGKTYKDGATVRNLANPGETITLHAQWKPINYTITYNSNKPAKASSQVTGSTASSDHTYDVSKSLTPNGFDLTGWTFTGWNTKADGTGNTYKDKESVINLTTKNKDNIILYAQWRQNTYTITYNSNKPATASNEVTGSTPDSNHTYDVAKNLTSSGYSLIGWTFNGWNTKADGTGKSYQNKQSVINLTAKDKDTVVLYAQWKANTYTITYNSNKPSAASSQVTGSTASSNHTYDISKSLTPNGFTLTGWTFTGWNTKADGTGKTYGNKESVINLTANDKDNVILYAQWRQNTYTITYNSNKPAAASNQISGSTASSNHTYDVSKNLTPNGFTLKGWTFTDWNTKADGTGKSYQNKQSVINLTSKDKDTVILYAQWKANTYTIKYDGNGSTSGSTPDSNFTYDKSGDLNPNGFKKDNATFVGWNTKKDGTGTSFKEKQTVSNITDKDKDTVILYAQWDLAPEIKAGEKTFYEGMTVTRADLMKDVTASDKEDGTITKNVIITKIEYSKGKVVNGTKQPAYSKEWPNGMPDNETLDTWFMQLDKADSPVTHKVTYKVTDSAGNVTTKTVNVYVKYNEPPVITAIDRYFTLDEAQSGKITADELLKNAVSKGKLTSTDIEEGNLSSKVELVDFNPADFTKLTSSAEVTVTYKVHDSYGPNGVGKETINQIKVYVSDGSDPGPGYRPDPKESIVKHVRFITKKYYDLNKDKKDKDFNDDTELAKANANGGLRVGSDWYTNDDYKSLITSTFSKTTGTTYTFTHEDVEKLKDYVETNGIGNAKKTDALDKFYQQFMNK